MSFNHLIIVVLVIVVIFGSSKLPDLARNIRLSMDELKKPSDNNKKNEESKEAK